MARVLLNFRSGFAGLREGFEALGHEVAENQWMPDATALRGAALCVADFVDCARNLRRTLGLKHRLAQSSVPFVALNRDAPFNRGIHPARLAVIALLKPFDGYASHSMQAAARFSARTLYCPNAARERFFSADESQLRAMRDPGRYRWDVSFFGNIDSKRYREHARRAEFLHVLQGRLESANLKVLFRDSAGMSETEQLEILRMTRVNFSTIAACDAGAEPSWGLPERCYGVPACGGFLLSDRRRHAPEDFADDERAEYGSLDECVAMVRHFVERFGDARSLAERACVRVARDHGYRNRAARLLDFAAHAF
ncbi:MAG: glycosyltransferase [Candidatus Parcubacteria bacterium]|nr:glycosyltransferase [Burkholderiales bacterium]